MGFNSEFKGLNYYNNIHLLYNMRPQDPTV